MFKTETRDPQDLRRHRLRAQIPEPGDNEEWEAFIENFRDAGVEAMPPILVTHGNKVLKGWRRVLAARRLQWEKVPCRVIEEADAPAVMFESWLGQRPMSAATKIRFFAKFFKDYVDTIEERRLRRIEGKKETSGRKVELPAGSRSGNHCDTVDAPSDSYNSLRLALGVGRNCFYSGLALARILDEPNSVELIDLLKRGRRKTDPGSIVQLQAELRAEYDPQLESGEMSVWSVRSAIGSRIVTEDRDRPVGAAAQLEFWANHIHPLMSAMQKWKQVPAEVQQRVKSDLRTLLNRLPEADRDEIFNAIK